MQQWDESRCLVYVLPMPCVVLSKPCQLPHVLSVSCLRLAYVFSTPCLHLVCLSCPCLVYVLTIPFRVLFRMRSLFLFNHGSFLFLFSSNQSLGYLQRTGLPRAGHIQLTKSRLVVMKWGLCRCGCRRSCPGFVLSLYLCCYLSWVPLILRHFPFFGPLIFGLSEFHHGKVSQSSPCKWDELYLL